MNIGDLTHIELRGRTARGTEVVVRGEWKPSDESNDQARLEVIAAFEKLAELLGSKWQTASEPVTPFT